MAYGVVPTGFRAKTLAEIKTEIENACRADISPIINVGTNTVLGQYNGIIASKARELWELGQVAVSILDPDNASDAQLAKLSLMTGTERKDATLSSVKCTCNLDAGTYAPGSLKGSVVGAPDNRFVNRLEVISPGGSVLNIIFDAEESGPVQALAGTLTVIAEPVVGFNSITNPTDADLGEPIETDPALRLRREAEVAASGSAADLAVQAGVSKVPGVISAKVLSNDTPTPNSDGVPGHSQEVVVFDGIVPAASNDAIAQAIFDNAVGGIGRAGSTTGTAIDSEGTSHVMRFSRVVIDSIYLILDIEVIADRYVGDAALKLALVTWGDANLTPGIDVRNTRISSVALAQSGVLDVTSVKLGTAPFPVSTTNVGIGPRVIADLDTARITINATPVSLT